MKIGSDISKGIDIKPLIDSVNDRIVIIDLKSKKELSAKEIYTIVFTSNKSNYSFSESISRLTFSKIPLRIKLTVNIESNLISFSTKLFNNRFDAILNDVETNEILKTGYIINNASWFPVDSDDLSQLQSVFNLITKQSSLISQLNTLFKFRSCDIIEFAWTDAEYKSLVYNTVDFGIPISFTKQLYDYQKSGLKWLQNCCIRNTGTLLGDDMGLGKTAQIISLVSWLIENNLCQNILIVVPSTLLENWRREFVFFAPSIDVHIHHGNIRTGSIKEIMSKKVIVTSYSMIINDQYLFNKIEWELIIADEASLLKNPDSERRIALSKLNRRIFIAMTGTPIENSLLDLWSLVDLISPGYFGTKEDFSNRYIRKSIERTLAESDLAEIKNQLNYLLIRRKKEDVLDSLPPRIDIHQALEMSVLEAEEYENRRQLVNAQVNNNSFNSIFPLIQDLRQFTTHPLINKMNIEDLIKIDFSEHIKSSNKLARLFELLNEISKTGEKVLIFTEYIKMIDLLSDLIRKKYSCNVYNIDGRIETVNRQIAIDEFSNSIGFSVLVLNPKTAGMGLNITAANHVIHFTRQWNPALEEQASARAYRNKQTKPVNIYYLYYINSIEEFIDLRLRQKSNLSSEIISVNLQELSSDDLQNILNMTPNKKQ